MQRTYLCWKTADCSTAEITRSVNGWYECTSNCFNSQVLNLHARLRLSEKSHRSEKKIRLQTTSPSSVALHCSWLCVEQVRVCGTRSVSDGWVSWENQMLKVSWRIFMIRWWDPVSEGKWCQNPLFPFLSVSVNNLEHSLPSPPLHPCSRPTQSSSQGCQCMLKPIAAVLGEGSLRPGHVTSSSQRHRFQVFVCFCFHLTWMDTVSCIVMLL